MKRVNTRVLEGSYRRVVQQSPAVDAEKVHDVTLSTYCIAYLEVGIGVMDYRQQEKGGCEKSRDEFAIEYHAA